MPIPKPRLKEKQKDFMLRCIPEMMKEAKKDQAIAICYKSFKDKK
jgi:ribosomal protein S7